MHKATQSDIPSLRLTHCLVIDSSTDVFFKNSFRSYLPSNPIWNDLDFCCTLPCFMFSAKCHNIKWWTQLSRAVINSAMHMWTAATAYMESKHLLLLTFPCRIVVAFDRSPMTITKLHWSQSKGKRPISQKAVSAYFTSKQILPFGFAEQYTLQPQWALDMHGRGQIRTSLNTIYIQDEQLFCTSLGWQSGIN